MIYGYVADTLDRALREAAMMLRYENWCDWLAETMGRMMEYCKLKIAGKAIGGHADRLKPPDYY